MKSAAPRFHANTLNIGRAGGKRSPSLDAAFLPYPGQFLLIRHMEKHVRCISCMQEGAYCNFVFDESHQCHITNNSKITMTS